MNPKNVKSELEYYLGYEPSDDLVLEALDWMLGNPGVALDEWVSAMQEAGMLS